MFKRISKIENGDLYLSENDNFGRVTLYLAPPNGNIHFGMRFKDKKDAISVLNRVIAVLEKRIEVTEQNEDDERG